MNTEENKTVNPSDGQGQDRRANRKRGAGRGKHRGAHAKGAGRPRRTGRRKRPLAHGDLRLLLLSIIKATPSHGYGLINEIKTRTSGLYEPSPGVIYPAIETLQDLGWVEMQAEKGKRVLYITKAGQTELSAQSEAIDQIEDRLQKLSSNEQAVEHDDIRGALRQLRHTTASVFKGKNVDTDTRIAAVTVLKDARKKIAELDQ